MWQEIKHSQHPVNTQSNATFHNHSQNTCFMDHKLYLLNSECHLDKIISRQT